MLIRTRHEIPTREITDERLYLNRRAFMRSSVATVAALAGVACAEDDLLAQDPSLAVIPDVVKSPLSTTGEDLTSFDAISSYNNFFEFGTDKSDPKRHSGRFTPRPWSVRIDGHVNKPGDYQLEDLLKWFPLEERVYRLRCVEAWSMVIPWVGFGLGDLLARVEPTSKARYVAFTTVERPAEMPGLKYPSIPWPYREGLRLDEAQHRLTMLAVGLYGRVLPNQNGAPIRLVVPWKYGFKSIKSIVRIELTEEPPPTAWNMLQPREYGFYSNVNPEFDHPRWSQARERRIGELLRRRTLMFNGYADDVASLYAGMDLRKHY
jgi:methionine sulfoxide reductase catalytic subunit